VSVIYSSTIARRRAVPLGGGSRRAERNYKNCAAPIDDPSRLLKIREIADIQHVARARAHADAAKRSEPDALSAAAFTCRSSQATRTERCRLLSSPEIWS